MTVAIVAKSQMHFISRGFMQQKKQEAPEKTTNYKYDNTAMTIIIIIIIGQ